MIYIIKFQFLFWGIVLKTRTFHRFVQLELLSSSIMLNIFLYLMISWKPWYLYFQYIFLRIDCICTHIRNNLDNSNVLETLCNLRKIFQKYSKAWFYRPAKLWVRYCMWRSTPSFVCTPTRRGRLWWVQESNTPCRPRHKRVVGL